MTNPTPNRKPSAKTSWIKCRIPPAQKTRYVKAAQARGMTLTDFMFLSMDEKIARGSDGQVSAGSAGDGAMSEVPEMREVKTMTEILRDEDCDFMSSVADEIDSLRAKLSKREWISVEDESTPHDGTVLLLGWWQDWPERRWKTEVAKYSNVDIARRGSASMHGWATHWMPLPEPPK